MSLYFTSDTHFTLKDYDGVVVRDARPFSSCQKMIKEIVKIWNKQAGKNDTIYHLGDFVNYNCKDNKNYEYCFSLVKKIKAKVILILGNNEERIMRNHFDNDFEKFKAYLLNLGFADVVLDGIHLDLGRTESCDGVKAYLNHYPMKREEGILNLFGHIHSTVKVKPYGFNVGVDVNHFRLNSEKYILYLLECQPKFDENVYN